MKNFLERDSVMVRYAEHLKGIEPQWIKSATIQEGAEIRYGRDYKSIQLGILDLSSYAATRSFKSSVACLTVATCLKRGIDRFVTQSSGNTANALALYAAKAEISALILYPASSRYKIEPPLTESPFVKLVEFSGAEEELKLLIQQYSEVTGIPWLPNVDIQVESNKVRAYFLADYESQHGIRFNWHVQALSSGWGVFGFYQGVEELRADSQSLHPRFFGVQQEAISPFYDHLNPQKSKSMCEVIEPTLFRTQPTVSMLTRMRDIVERSNGKVVRLSNSAYEHYESLAVQILLESGICLSTISVGERCIFKEKAGLIALAGILQEIDLGLITEGDNVLVCFTGGSGLDRTRLYEPTHVVHSHNGLDNLLKIGNDFYPED